LGAKKPGLHTLPAQAAAPAAVDHVPAGHTEQLLEPGDAEKEPAGHSVHVAADAVVAPDSAYEPAAHCAPAHVPTPPTDEYVPGAHKLQLVKPAHVPPVGPK
jgi:hypothetical protein